MDINLLLFPDFETLDAFGPVEVLGRIPEYALHYCSMDGGPVESRQSGTIITESIENVDKSGILLIPGGQGTRPLVEDELFISRLKRLAEQSSYCLTVCTGSALLAKTTLLDSRKATSNKRAFEWAREVNPNVQWEARARWVSDDKFYTSSGVSAGIDLALGFVADQFGIARAEEIASAVEYIWNSDQHHDPFSNTNQ
ncbi:DJ-1/PfpI family protein [Sporolactobacillus terrae]|uniref:DJ-1/PfpI family protein n=1 Tax=Sporolactobacillus terrae TaxID=269673 RepID=UPI00048E170F|nr:DJ-1/PfpI family protein [Sporolactobacillus terrae]